MADERSSITMVKKFLGKNYIFVIVFITFYLILVFDDGFFQATGFYLFIIAFGFTISISLSLMIHVYFYFKYRHSLNKATEESIITIKKDLLEIENPVYILKKVIFLVALWFGIYLYIEILDFYNIHVNFITDRFFKNLFLIF